MNVLRRSTCNLRSQILVGCPGQTCSYRGFHARDIWTSALIGGNSPPILRWKSGTFVRVQSLKPAASVQSFRICFPLWCDTFISGIRGTILSLISVSQGLNNCTVLWEFSSWVVPTTLPSQHRTYWPQPSPPLLRACYWQHHYRSHRLSFCWSHSFHHLKGRLETKGRVKCRDSNGRTWNPSSNESTSTRTNRFHISHRFFAMSTGLNLRKLISWLLSMLQLMRIT